MAGPNAAEGFADPAFEEPPRRGSIRVQYGNRDSASRDDASRIDLLTAQVSDLLARVEALEGRVEEMEGGLGEHWNGDDDEPPL